MMKNKVTIQNLNPDKKEIRTIDTTKQRILDNLKKILRQRKKK